MALKFCLGTPVNDAKSRHHRDTKVFHQLLQRTQHTSTLQVLAQLNHRTTLLRTGVIKVRLSTQHLTSHFHQLMWHMKKNHRPLAHVKILDDHYSSVISAPNVNISRKGRSFCATNGRNTNPVSNARIPIAITYGQRVVNASTENTSGGRMDCKTTKSKRY